MYLTSSFLKNCCDIILSLKRKRLYDTYIVTFKIYELHRSKYKVLKEYMIVIYLRLNNIYSFNLEFITYQILCLLPFKNWELSSLVFKTVLQSRHKNTYFSFYI